MIDPVVPNAFLKAGLLSMMVCSEDGGGGWPWIDMNNLPVGAVSVPVTVDDNGTEYKTQMVAGQMAYNVVGDRLDTIQPRSDWCIALDEKDAPPRKKSRS